MSLLIVSGLFYPAKLGGLVSTLFWLSKALVSKGIKVSVVVSNHKIDEGTIQFNKWLSLTDGLRIRYCSKKTLLGLRQVFWAVREMNNSDIVMLSSICYLPNTLVYIAAIIRHKKIIWSPRGELFDSAVQNSKQKRLFFSFLNSILSPKVVFHATSRQERETVNRYLPSVNKIAVIPNYFELPEKEGRKRQESPYFIYVGRINPLKALDNLLRGLAMSTRFMQSDYRLLLVGPDQASYSQVLKVLARQLGIESRVEFLPGLYGKKKYQAYSNALFTFLVSHSENFGNVVIESLSQGTPVVAAKGTPWECLDESGAGFWIENDPQSISKCVDEIMCMPLSRYNDMRVAAEDLALSFDVNENIDSWVELLNSI